MRILITGATGLVGRKLIAALSSRGNRILALSRRTDAVFPKGVTVRTGDPTVAGPWQDSLNDVDAVVHLAGENIFARRWSNRFKSTILRSRVESTRLIAELLAKRKASHPVTFISASAIGYYGSCGDRELTEADAAGTDFMAQVCRQWEAAADPARQAGIRVVHPRLGIVLDRDGGALPTMVRPFRFFLGGPMAGGRQWFSWVHIDDVIGSFQMMLDRTDIHGAVNVTSPQPVKNREISRAIGKALNRPSWLPTPRWMLRLALGEVADAIAGSQRVIPRRLLVAGYRFLMADLSNAMIDLLGQRASLI